LARRPDGGAAWRRGKTTLKPHGDAQQFSVVYNKGRTLETTNTDNDFDCSQLNKYVYSPGQKVQAKAVRDRKHGLRNITLNSP